MAQTLDIFKGSAFSALSMTDAINKLPYVPGRIGALGIFEERGVPTRTIMVEEREGLLSLIPTSPRGAPAEQNKPGKRTARSLTIPHLAIEDTINADEVQDVRAFGSDSTLESMGTVVNQRMADMSQKLDATNEHLRIGAIKGKILDADGSTELYNLFTEFNVNQAAVVDFDLDNASPVAGAVRKKCMDVKRTVIKALGNVPLKGIHAFCGDAFFDDLITHVEIREAYERFMENAHARSDLVYAQFTYAGIVFENYQGGIGDTPFVGTDAVHFFPTGVAGLFKQYYAPADFSEAVNTIGLPRYAKVALDYEFQRWVKIHVQSNPLPICTRPAVLITGKRT